MKRGPIIFNHPPPSFFQECIKKTGQEQSIISYMNPSDEQIENSRKLIFPKDIHPSLNLLKKDFAMPILPEKDKSITKADKSITKTDYVKSTPKIKSKKNVFKQIAHLNVIKRVIETMKQGSSVYLSKMLKKTNFQIVGDIVCNHFEGNAKVFEKKINILCH